MTNAVVNRVSGIPRAFGQRGGGTYQSSGDNERRLAQLLTAHFSLVWRSLRRFGVESGTVDDAAQHVFLTFAERLPDVSEGRERSFLLGLCVRVAANARRRQARSPETPIENYEYHPAVGVDPEELLDSKERRAALDRALDELPLDQRSVFVLFELEGFSLPEIAESLQIPLGTATSRLRRARQRFEQWIDSQQSEGGFHE